MILHILSFGASWYASRRRIINQLLVVVIGIRTPRSVAFRDWRQVSEVLALSWSTTKYLWASSNTLLHWLKHVSKSQHRQPKKAKWPCGTSSTTPQLQLINAAAASNLKQVKSGQTTSAIFLTLFSSYLVSRSQSRASCLSTTNVEMKRVEKTASLRQANHDNDLRCQSSTASQQLQCSKPVIKLKSDFAVTPPWRKHGIIYSGISFVDGHLTTTSASDRLIHCHRTSDQVSRHSQFFKHSVDAHDYNLKAFRRSCCGRRARRFTSYNLLLY